MRGNKTLFAIYAAGVMILLLYSMHAYFLWWMYDDPRNQFFVDGLVAVIGIMYINSCKIPIRFNANVIAPFVIIWIATAWNPIGISWIIQKCPFTLLTLLMVDKIDLQRLLSIWTKMYAWILLISLIAWPLALLGVIPSQGIISFGDEEGYVFQNFLFCIVNMNLVNFEVIRFCSIFLEPGHIAMIGAFTLYANRFDFKNWTTWVIFLVCLISVSLAGYVLMAVGYILLKMQGSSFKKSSRAVLGGVIIITIGYFAAITYKNGDNLIKEQIVDRLAYDEEKGIAGNNRFFGKTDDTFDMFLASQDFLTGFSKSKYSEYIQDRTIGGAGYKMYLMEMGLLGTLFAFVGYWLIAKRAITKKYVKYFLLLYIIAFVQRSWPTTHIWLYLFVFATSVDYSMKNRTIQITHDSHL